MKLSNGTGCRYLDKPSGVMVWAPTGCTHAANRLAQDLIRRGEADHVNIYTNWDTLHESISREAVEWADRYGEAIQREARKKELGFCAHCGDRVLNQDGSRSQKRFCCGQCATAWSKEAEHGNA